MSSRVVHVSVEAHSKAKEYCKERNLQISKWVSELIIYATENSVTPIKNGVTPVDKMILMDLSVPKDDEIFLEPAFWDK